jgi:hypothetical protein
MVTDILTAPCRANERSKVVYFFNGDTCCDVQSGTEEQQRAAFLLVSQAREMAKMLRDFLENYELGPEVDARLATVLRAAGVSDKALDSEGR